VFSICSKLFCKRQHLHQTPLWIREIAEIHTLYAKLCQDFFCPHSVATCEQVFHSTDDIFAPLPCRLLVLDESNHVGWQMSNVFNLH